MDASNSSSTVYSDSEESDADYDSVRGGAREGGFVIVKGGPIGVHSTIDCIPHFSSYSLSRRGKRQPTPSDIAEECVKRYDPKQSDACWFPEVACVQENATEVVRESVSRRSYGPLSEITTPEYSSVESLGVVLRSAFNRWRDAEDKRSILRLIGTNTSFDVSLRDPGDADGANAPRAGGRPANLVLFRRADGRDDVPTCRIMALVAESVGTQLYNNSDNWRAILNPLRDQLPGMNDGLFAVVRIDDGGRERWLGSAYRYYGPRNTVAESILAETAIRALMRSSPSFISCMNSADYRLNAIHPIYTDDAQPEEPFPATASCDDYGWVESSYGPGLDLQPGATYCGRALPSDLPSETSGLREVESLLPQTRMALEEVYGIDYQDDSSESGADPDIPTDRSTELSRYSPYCISNGDSHMFDDWLRAHMKTSFDQTYLWVEEVADVYVSCSEDSSGEDDEGGGEASSSVDVVVTSCFSARSKEAILADGEDTLRIAESMLDFGRADFVPEDEERNSPVVETVTGADDRTFEVGRILWCVKDGWIRRRKFYPERDSPSGTFGRITRAKRRIMAVSKMSQWKYCSGYNAGLSWFSNRSSVRGNDDSYDENYGITTKTMIKLCGLSQNAGSGRVHSPEPSVEMVAVIFSGADLTPIAKKFFFTSKSHIATFMREIRNAVAGVTDGATILRAGVQPFAVAVASAGYDFITGSRGSQRLLCAYGGLAQSESEILSSVVAQVFDRAKMYSIAAAHNTPTVESLPEVGTVPCRFVLRFGHHHGRETAYPCMTFCRKTRGATFPYEEAEILGYEALDEMPTQPSYAHYLTAHLDTPGHAGRPCLGIFFPVKGFSFLTTGDKQALGEWVRRFIMWFQWGGGRKHYEALRRLVPICDHYLVDAYTGMNYYCAGMLFHLHCLPMPERERTVVAVLATAIRDSALFPETSLCVEMTKF